MPTRRLLAAIGLAAALVTGGGSLAACGGTSAKTPTEPPNTSVAPPASAMPSPATPTPESPTPASPTLSEAELWAKFAAATTRVDYRALVTAAQNAQTDPVGFCSTVARVVPQYKALPDSPDPEVNKDLTKMTDDMSIVDSNCTALINGTLSPDDLVKTLNAAANLTSSDYTNLVQAISASDAPAGVKLLWLGVNTP